MAELTSWRVLATGTGDRLVLAVDFATGARPESGFPDLAPNLDPAFSVWETLPPGPGDLAAGPGGPDPQDYVARWAGEVERSGRTVDAILGYCVGAVFAAALAERVAAWQDRPPTVVLFDPEAPNRAGLVRDYEAVVRNFAALLAPQDVDDALRLGGRALDEHEDFGRLGEALAEALSHTVGAGFERAGLDADLGDELLETFRSFVVYLQVARMIDPAAVWSRAAAVTSATSSGGAALSAREIKCEVEHLDILRSPQVARTVLDLVG